MTLALVALVSAVAAFSPRAVPKAPLRSVATVSSLFVAERAPASSLTLADDDGCKKSACRCSDCKACCKGGKCTAGNSCCDTRCCCADEETCGPGCPG